MSIPPAQLAQLKAFVNILKAQPALLHTPELAFLRDYLESLGATLPPKPEPKQEKEKTPEPAKEDTPAPPEPEEESQEDEPMSEESDVELDMEGVVEADQGDPQSMGDPNKELSEDDFDKFDAKRSEAMSVFSEGEWEKAIPIFTEAIEINATSAMPFVKRGQCFMKLSKPNACIRDCTRAIEINPDNAAAHKYRGRANRLLGNFLEAAKDLRLACKIDFDDQADEWLREVTPNAKKIEEHERKKQRKREEKEIAEKKDRIKKAQEARAKAAEEASDMGGMPGGMPGGMGGMGGLFSDPELLESLSDPEVAAAFEDITSNPANIMKYQGNPKVMKLLTKMAGKMGGGGGGMGGLGGMFGGMGGAGGMPGGMGGMPGGMGGMPGGMGGMPGGMGGMPGGAAPPPSGGKPPSATDDLD